MFSITTMRGRSVWAAIALVTLAGGCVRPSVSVVQQRKEAMLAINSLRAGEFDQAARESNKVVARSRGNIYARLVRAIARYRATMHQLSTDVRTVVFGAFHARGFNHQTMRSTLRQAEEQLALVAQDLAAAKHRDVYLELCLACWEVDWNRNGRIDRRDRLLFQIENDAEGRPLPKDDPRRRPVFRFDHGDVAWAQAFVNFQRAAIDVVLAYNWVEIEKIFFSVIGRLMGSQHRPIIRIKMAHPELMKRAREKLLAGLDFAEECRRAYLAEKDDEREWIPNPRQHNHPMPLPVDDKLYQTWAAMIEDLRRIVTGKDGLGVAELAQLGDHQWSSPPTGYIDIGRMFSDPRDIVVDVAALMRLNLTRADAIESALSSILGPAYVPQMRSSPMTQRLSRMKHEIKRGEESLERKLRYLLWLN